MLVGQASVVDEDGQSAELFDSAVDALLPLILAGDIVVDEDGLRALRLQLLDELLALVILNIGDHNVRALGCETFGGSLADAAC